MAETKDLNTDSDGPSTFSRATMAAGVGLVALIVVAGLVVSIVTLTDDDGDGTSPSPSASGSSTPSASGGEQETIPSGFVTLPKSTNETLGYPTGYPHTPQGATALVAAKETGRSGLDYDETLRNTKAYFTGLDDYRDFADQVVTHARQTMDLVPLCVKSGFSACGSVRRRLSPSRSFVRWGAPP